ncbi:MAG TPA: hypothetical protein PK883_01135, partial [Anaerolineaceae bacterium]|nr:hypothetical protein [Anaerolineaceae bacterium]
MRYISSAKLTEYRNQTFRFRSDLRLKEPQQAVDFVNERGFIFFWPVKGYSFPSLWGAVAGDRPVADEHDDPGHVTWNWKDSLLDKKVWYYARILKRKNTFISLDMVRYFYALSPNYGEPEADFADQYNQGLLPLEAKLIFEALVRKGPLDTLSLRKEAHLSGSNSTSPFNRALDLLQQQFKVLPIAISEAGAWKYAFVYDLTHRYFPELPEQARFISESRALEQILMQFFTTMGAANLKKITSLFQWSADRARNAL